MSKAQGGDAEAYKTLLQELMPVVQSFCRKRLSGFGEAEDVAQEAIMGIHKVRHTYDPNRKFTPWMYAVVRYKLIDYLRRKTRVTKNEIQNPEFVERAMALPAEKSDREGLSEAISSLKDTYREILELMKVKGLSVKEVATELGISESAVKVRAHRAIGMLRKKLVRNVYEK